MKARMALTRSTDLAPPAASTAATIRSKRRSRAQLIVGLWAMMLCAPAWATLYTVSNTNDSGAGSLRAAIEAANTHVGDDEVVFSLSGTVFLNSTLPLISDDLLITGPDGGGIGISGGNAVRVLEVTAAATVGISNVVIHSGLVSSGDGGCIHNAGSLVLIDSEVALCEADDFGGGIYNAASGVLTLVNSRVDEASAYRGGGIYNAGVLIIKDASSVVSNSATFGAGIYNVEGASATLTDALVWGNQASIEGGGIVNDGGAVEIYRSNLSSNSANSGGGISFNGISSNFDSLVIGNSTLSNNSASGDGGAILIFASNNTSIFGSTLASNDAQYGGAIHGDDFRIRNSTISLNHAAFSGGGIYITYSGASLSHVTLVNNSADSNEAQTIHGQYSAKNIIIVGNAPNCDANIDAFGDNLIQAPGGDFSCQGFDPVSAAQLQLGTLADNGGATKTHALLDGSVAIDAASDCTDIFGNPVDSDQRGVARPFDGNQNGLARCDVGAYESSDVLFADGFEGTATP